MEETKYILMRFRMENGNPAFKIEKRNSIDLENYEYLTTNKDSSVVMQEYCLKEDYGFFKQGTTC